jgi:hypothetical protein
MAMSVRPSHGDFNRTFCKYLVVHRFVKERLIYRLGCADFRAIGL